MCIFSCIGSFTLPLKYYMTSILVKRVSKNYSDNVVPVAISIETHFFISFENYCNSYNIKLQCVLIYLEMVLQTLWTITLFSEQCEHHYFRIMFSGTVFELSTFINFKMVFFTFWKYYLGNNSLIEVFSENNYSIFFLNK